MNKIKEARLEKGYSRREISDLLKIPYNTITNWEREERQCPEWAELLIIEKVKSLKEK